eukprot:gene4656-4702_t
MNLLFSRRQWVAAAAVALLDATDNVPTGGTTAEFARQIALESENNARIIRAAGIQGN